MCIGCETWPVRSFSLWFPSCDSGFVCHTTFRLFHTRNMCSTRLVLTFVKAWALGLPKMCCAQWQMWAIYFLLDKYGVHTLLLGRTLTSQVFISSFYTCSEVLTGVIISHNVKHPLPIMSRGETIFNFALHHWCFCWCSTVSIQWCLFGLHWFLVILCVEAIYRNKQCNCPTWIQKS